MTQRHSIPLHAIRSAISNVSRQRLMGLLMQALPSVLLRVGELASYRRTCSLMHQCRFKLTDGKWVRFTTCKASLENAIADLAY